MAHEINLINARMTWLVVSESFIFGAYAAVVSASRDTSASRALLWVLVVLGILMVAFVWPSLLKAKKVMHALYYDRDKVDQILIGITALDLTRLGPDRDETLRNTHRVGDMPVDLVPPLLAIAWIVVAILQIEM